MAFKYQERRVTAAEFEERLAVLCVRGGGSAFPARRRDRHILFRSVVQALDATKGYSESMLNAALQQWLSGVGAGVGVDHVTLRRYLVDEGYLLRDPKGSAYEIRVAGKAQLEFEADVSGIDSSGVVQTARLRAAERKRRQVEGTSGS